ncbi:FAD-NAD(P)-binding-domain-containing protein [Pestalotiopsis sp. NC0098]|nr:FAD-NAD(P)-binding-domain-containing protein [Pestalotiopsis sp. NC0098]
MGTKVFQLCGGRESDYAKWLEIPKILVRPQDIMRVSDSDCRLGATGAGRAVMPETSVVIVGAGQRGLSTLERICTLYQSYSDAPRLRIHVVDPGQPGQGSHIDSQPEHLLTNTSTAQITVFVDSSVENSGPTRSGPSYSEWLWLAGYRWRDGIVQGDGDPIPDDTYTSRALLGSYLRWCFDHIRESAPVDVVVQEHRTEAIGIERDGEGFHVNLRGEDAIHADYVFVTTGHASGRISVVDELALASMESMKSRNPHIGFIPSAAAFSRLDVIQSDAKVLICGTGLSAADALSGLTTGRGGRFEVSGKGRLLYVPSGQEPKVTLYSRQGLPAGAKGVNQKALGDEYEATCFTPEFIDAKRRESSQLSWEQDIFPCLIREIEACWASTVARGCGPAAPGPDAEQVRSIVHKLLHPWDNQAIRSPEDHRRFVLAHLSDDIDAAFRGNVSHPAKAVAEMLRDLNDVVRQAVNYGGLDEQSHRIFLRDWVSINNRLAAGPPKERNMQLLALIEAGIVDIFEPGPEVVLDGERACYKATSARFGYLREEHFDVLVRARVAPFNLDLSPSPFFSTGKQNGIFSPFLNGSFGPGGIAIDRSLNVISAQGVPIRNMWAMGFVVEGANYYTNVLPCPLSNSCSLRDAAKAARAMLEHASCKSKAIAGSERYKASRMDGGVEAIPMMVTTNGLRIQD